MNELVFTEKQGFRTRWAWAAVIVFNAFFLYAIVQQVIFGIPFGSKPAPDMVLILLELIPLSITLLMLCIRLSTRFDEEGIQYRFFPFQSKTTRIQWHELQDVYLRTYRSFYEYGGWGIRCGGEKNGDAINTSQSGRTGVQLVFKHGRKLLIGTRYPEKIRPIVESALATGKVNRGI